MLVFLNAICIFLTHHVEWQTLDGVFFHYDERGMKQPVKANTLYKRYHNWVRKGVIERILERIQGLVYTGEIPFLAMDSSCIKCAPGAYDIGDWKAIGLNVGGRNMKVHVATSNDCVPLLMEIGPGNESDYKVGERLARKLVEGMENGGIPTIRAFSMDRGYSGRSIHGMLVDAGIEPVIPPKSNMKDPWEYDKGKYGKRSIVENFFNRLKRYTHLSVRSERNPHMVLAFLQLACILNYLLAREHPMEGRWKKN